MSFKRILMIDDEEGILAVVRVGLKLTAGWEVLTAVSGTDGIEKAKAERPDAILLDMMMPDMDGIETLSHLKREPQTQNIPVIIVTAKVKGGTANGVANLDLAGVLTKPFDSITLSERIATILGWQ